MTSGHLLQVNRRSGVYGGWSERYAGMATHKVLGFSLSLICLVGCSDDNAAGNTGNAELAQLMVDAAVALQGLPPVGGAIDDTAAAELLGQVPVIAEVPDAAVPESVDLERVAAAEAEISAGYYACGVLVSTMNWQQSATLLVTLPGLLDNPADIGLFTRFSPTVGQSGALWFGSNTAFCSVVNCRDSGRTELAQVQTEPVERGFEALAMLTSPATGYGTLNTYNLTSGVAAQVHFVTGGGVRLRLDQLSNAVAGVVQLQGTPDFARPDITSAYQAEFSGRCQWVPQ